MNQGRAGSILCGFITYTLLLDVVKDRSLLLVIAPFDNELYIAIYLKQPPYDGLCSPRSIGYLSSISRWHWLEGTLLVD